MEKKIGIVAIIITLIIIASIGGYLLIKEKTQDEKVYQVGILCGLDFISGITDSFKAKMAELDYIEGENIEYDVQNTNFEPEREKQILEKFVEDKVDIIYTFPTEVSMEAKSTAQGTGIPVLFCFANIEGTGLVDSITNPGGDITGVRYPGPDLAVKRFEIMQELVPDAKRIWIPYQMGYPIVQSQLDAISPAAEAAGVTIIEFPANNSAEVQAELDRVEQLDDIGFDAILFVAEPLTVTVDVYQVLTTFAHEQNMPIGGAIMHVEGHGVIFGVNAQLDDMGQKSAILADKILRGTKAGTIPVVSADQFFTIDYKTAQELEVDIPEDLLNMADEVIY